ncbi:MAG: small basic family protein [Firmicutes bacterium]|nr:small basic family protein [Bacillota bacterium]
MWIPLLALIVGLAAGFLSRLSIPAAYADYLAISLLAALDSVFGGIRAGLSRTFNARVFISGFFTNTLLAALLTYFGGHLGVDLMLPASVAFGIRIFQNLGIIRNLLLNRATVRLQPPAAM